MSRWLTTAVGLTLLVALLSLLTGFVWLPMIQPDSSFRSAWEAFCSSAGLISARPVTEVATDSSYKTSAVVVSSGMLEPATPESIGRGATLALQCTMCHGARGLSDANTPNLAGQYAPAIYKQLRDFQSGARVSAIMVPLVANLGDRDMRDVAAYYAYLPRLHTYHPPSAGPAPQIVLHGAPMRNIPPCATCHGEVGYKVGTEWLEGESAVYLRSQLTAFASGGRHNDISQQMRNIARHMTVTEIEQAAAYYSSQP